MRRFLSGKCEPTIVCHMIQFENNLIPMGFLVISDVLKISPLAGLKNSVCFSQQEERRTVELSILCCAPISRKPITGVGL